MADTILYEQIESITILSEAIQGPPGPSGESALLSVTTKSSNYSLLLTDDVILGSGNIILELPTAIGNDGKFYYIKNIGTGTITVQPSVTQTIDGTEGLYITITNTTILVISDGANWVIL